MTQEEIFEMARQSDLGFLLGDNWMMHHEFVAFAHLVADKATEEANATANASWTLMCKKMVAIEREACAKLVDYWEAREGEHADAIRARGEQALAQPEQDGECKYCTHGCAACDARKLQKEAHDLL